MRVCDRVGVCNFKPSSSVILIINCYMQEQKCRIMYNLRFCLCCSLIDVIHEVSCINNLVLYYLL